MLKRELGFWSSVAIAIGGMIGGGIFVLLGIGAGIAGPYLPLAFIIAGLLAFFCAASSAELGAAYPLAGGTYEYAHKLVSPGVGFFSGFIFTASKILEAATVALAFGTYFALFLNINPVIIAAVGVAIFTAINYLGIRASARLNNIFVVIKVSILILLAVFSLGHLSASNFSNFSGVTAVNLFTASALLFFAYTGFARIATLGEEVKNPRKAIPKATMTALAITTLTYIAISSIAVAVVGSRALAASEQPLAVVAGRISPMLAVLVAFGALVATASVVFGDLLTSSRTMFAMGRRREFPGILGRIEKRYGSPNISVIATGVIAIAVVSLGSLTFAALLTSLTILVYYAITNFTALRLDRDKLIYPRVLSVLGLFGCLALAAFLPLNEWIATILLAAVAIIYYVIDKRLRRP
jgi:APA family basic amino acid/polyamine antiporter